MPSIKAVKQPFYILIIPQFLVLIVISLVGWAGFDRVVFHSVLFGGLICLVPNIYFSLKVFLSHAAPFNANDISSLFYRAEIGKMVLVAALFCIAFTQIKPLNPLALFIGFILVQCVGWFSPVFLKSENNFESKSKP